MALKRKPREPLEINVGSFADVAFLLIIFFILTTTFLKTAGNVVEIPAGKPPEETKKEEQHLTVNVSRNKIVYGEKAKEIGSIEELRAQLWKEDFKSGAENDRIVILESARDVPYERYYQIVMAITRAGGVLALVEEEEQKK